MGAVRLSAGTAPITRAAARRAGRAARPRRGLDARRRGEAGITRMLSIFKAEMRIALACTGTPKITEIDRRLLAR